MTCGSSSAGIIEQPDFETSYSFEITPSGDIPYFEIAPFATTS